MTEQEAISEIRENKYTGNCYLETGFGRERVYVAKPGSTDDREAEAYSRRSSRWTFIGYFEKGVKKGQ